MHRLVAINAFIKGVASALNRSVRDYEGAQDAAGREFYLLKTQVLIFYYDFALALTSVAKTSHEGFARAVCLKALVHSIYEYEKQLHEVLIPRILTYAASRKRPVDTKAIKLERRKASKQLATIRQWKELRNNATGHYGRDLEIQVRLLKTIDQETVFDAAEALISLSGFLLHQLPHRKRTEIQASA